MLRTVLSLPARRAPLSPGIRSLLSTAKIPPKLRPPPGNLVPNRPFSASASTLSREQLADLLQSVDNALHADNAGPDAADDGEDIPEPLSIADREFLRKRQQFQKLSLSFIGPFAAFAVTDQLTMLLCTDFMEVFISPDLGISTLHTAAWSNTWGLVYGAVAFWLCPGINSYGLRGDEIRSDDGKQAILSGSLIGLWIGATIGCFPLLWQALDLPRPYESAASSTTRLGDHLNQPLQAATSAAA